MSQSLRPALPLTHIVVWIFFFLSGACGLIYEVLWCRQLGLLFGNTAHSLSTVLVAFMGGLAIGSFIAGRFAHRIQRPFLIYGILEIVIGAYCAILPALFGNDSPFVPLYRSLYGESGSSALVAVRLVISLLLLLLPTICMGATLPLLTHHLVRTKTVMGRTVGALYAINSFGAVMGATLAGFVLLPMLGKSTTNLTAVLCNLGLGVLAIVLGWNDRVPQAASATASEPPSSETPAKPLVEQAPVSARAVRIAIFAFGLTGFAAMATQIGWTKAISLGTGSSTYAFSMIVSIFILGLSFGGAWGARAATRTRDPLALLARILLLTAFLNMAVAILLGYSPIFFFAGLAWGTQYGWNAVVFSQALIIALLIFGPTFLMGASMPLTLQVASHGSSGAARTTGNVYSVNTLGSILGSALGGLLLIPFLSVQIALESMALLYAIPGLALFALSESRTLRRERIRNFGIAGATVLIAIIGGRWNSALMSSGLYLMRNEPLIERIRAGDLAAAVPTLSDRAVLYHAEGAEATVTVLQVPRDITLKVGGKPEGSSAGDATTQTCLTLLPELLHPTGAKDVMLIGLGTGVSAGSAIAPQSVERLDAVEMSPEVVHASAWFGNVNGLKYSGTGNKRWIDTPRVKTIINDGRNHLLLSSRQYDVIASEPSNPWMAGVGNLFTKESFELSRKRLKPGGIMCQWIHSYSLDRAWFDCVVRTFCEVYPNVQIWQLQQRDFLLIGTEQPLRISPDLVRARLAEPEINRWLKHIDAAKFADVISMHIAHDSVLRQRTAAAPLHTDDNMLLEFNAPRSLQFHPALFDPSDYIPHPDLILDFGALKFDQRLPVLVEIDRSIAAREHDRFGAKFANYPTNMAAAQRLSPGIRPVQNWNDSVESQGGPQPLPLTLAELEAAVKSLESAVPFDVQKLDRARLLWVRELLDQNQPAPAITVLKQVTGFAAERDILLANALLDTKDYAGVKSAAEAARAAGAAPADAAYWIVRAEQMTGTPATARALLETYLIPMQQEQSTWVGRLWLLHGQLLLDEGLTDQSIRSASNALRLYHKRDESRLLEARIYRKTGRLDGNVEALRQRAYMLAGQERPWQSYTFARLELSQAVLAQGNTAEAIAQLNLTRRATDEFTVLFPNNARAWEARARNFIFYEKADPTEPAYRVQATAALKKMLECLNNDTTKVPPDLVPLLPK